MAYISLWVSVFAALIVAAFGQLCPQTDCRTCTQNSACFFDVSRNACLPVTTNSTVDKSSQVFEPFGCAVPLNTDFPYSADFARERALIFSAASNGEGESEVQPCLSNRTPGAKFYAQYSVSCDWAGSTCSGFIAVSPKEKAIVLTFRGSKGTLQFVNLGFNLISYSTVQSSLVGGKVFGYFDQALKLLWNSGIERDLRALKSEHPDYQLWTFGHSLGGSLASLAAAASVKAGIFTSDKVRSVTLGEPRTGDLAFAAVFANLVPNSYRVVHEADGVPSIPFRASPNDTRAYHHRFEVRYSYPMTADAHFFVNNRADSWRESKFSFSNFGDNKHVMYFEENIDTFYLTGCLRPETPTTPSTL